MTAGTSSVRFVAQEPGDHAAALAWLAWAVAVLSTWLAFGAVSPTAAGSTDRVAFVSTWAAAWIATIAVAGVCALLVRRGRTSPLWLLSLSLVPWLPLPATGSAVMWHGPAVAVLFALVALLILWPALARAARWLTGRGVVHQAGLAFAAAVVLFTLSAWRMQPQLPGGDEPHYLVITQSLLLDGDLRIENNHQRGDYASYTTQVLKPDSLKRGRDGEIYSIHAPGTSALVLPAFALGGYPVVVEWLAVLAALGSVLLWETSRRVTGRTGAAWIGWAAATLSAPFFFHAFAVYPDGPGAVIVMLVVSLLAGPERLRRRALCVLLGAAVAFLPWLHTRYAVIAGTAGLLILARVWHDKDERWARACAFLAIPVISLAAWLWFFYSLYGTFNPAAPYGGYTQSALEHAPRGLTGLLLDQQFGLIPNAPVFIAALGGFVALWRRQRRLTVELALIVVPYAIAVACYHMWWGGRSAPVRFLVPVLLPLGITVAAWWRDAGPAGRAFIGTSVLASVALSLGLAWVDHGALVFNVRDGYALWPDALVPLAYGPLALPSLFRGGPQTAWTVAIVWATWTVAAVVALGWAARRMPGSHDPGAAGDRWRVLVAAASCAVVTCASGTVWALAPGSDVAIGTGLLRVLRAAEAGPGLAWRAEEPFQIADPAALATSIELPTADRRPTTTATPLWVGRDVPAGHYELRSTSGLRVSGRIAVLSGRSDVPVAEAEWHDVPAGVLPVSIDLPAGSTALRITGDAMAARTTGALRLRLARRATAAGAPPDSYAVGLLRGESRATAWVLDTNAFVEPGAAWVRGGAETTLVVDGGGHFVELVLRGGPVATTCEISVGGGARRQVRLGPGTFEVIRVPAASPVAVRVRSGGGFRPRDHDPRNPDARWLGVRVELR